MSQKSEKHHHLKPLNSALKKALNGLNHLLKEYNSFDAEGRGVVSDATREGRAQILRQAVTALHEMGFHLINPQNFGERHVEALIQRWGVQGLSAATLQWRLSVLRTFCRWIGKAGMVRDAEFYLEDPAKARRVYVAKAKKTWSASAVDIATKILEVAEDDPVVAVQLLAMLAFALRAREAWRLRPHLADHKTYLAVNVGTKGDRDRTVPIETEGQRAVLDLLKRYATSLAGSTIPRRYRLKGWKKHFYDVCRSHGISREEGVVPHGLRHEAANELHRKLCREFAQKYPVSAQAVDAEEEKAQQEDLARRIVAEHLGHSRPQITNCYLGPKPPRRKKKGKKLNRKTQK